MSQDDEYFRVAVSSMLDRSQSGERIWHERVVPSTFRARRIGRLLSEIAVEARPAVVRTAYGEVPATAIPFRCDEINRVLIRITKGFLFLTHPEIDSASLNYRVTMIQQFRFTEMAPFLNKSFPYFELGDGLFRMWRGLVDTDLRCGTWVYLFYDSAGFGVEHSADDQAPLPI
jgi:hypothetical protein